MKNEDEQMVQKLWCRGLTMTMTWMTLTIARCGNQMRWFSCESGHKSKQHQQSRIFTAHPNRTQCTKDLATRDAKSGRYRRYISAIFFSWCYTRKNLHKCQQHQCYQHLWDQQRGGAFPPILLLVCVKKDCTTVLL